MNTKAKLLIVCAGVFVLMFSGCSMKGKDPAAPPPPSVEVVRVEQRDVPIYSEWIGTLDGMVNAEIRAQVSGYLLRQVYHEGSFVRRGELMFEIDPRPFQAALDQAKGDLAKANAQLAQANSQLLQAQAQLAQAEANKGKTQLDVDRYTPLAKENAITVQDLDNAVQSNLAAQAQVKASSAGVETAKSAIVAAKATIAAAEAAVKTAELNLGFTKITSPIDGVAGIAQAQVGNLVSPTSGPITIVSTLDPIRVYFTPTEQEYLNFTRTNPTQSQRDAAGRKLELELVLVDGTIYPRKGRFFVADRQVDQKTGAIRLAGIFPNPGNTLRPGQYGRVRAITSVKYGALLIPQRAVSELQGSYRVAVVGSDNKVKIRQVKVGNRVDSMWIIEEGLKAGETVIAEGTQKVRPDMIVNPKPFASAAPIAER
ncbi:MAG: efflux RND transporter periplasmic adaptor subunit [Blastocatellia bacterium]|nr:efflux RND transporter periplasmic adaptor subunit [Blastocatellia bacterium]